MRVAVDTNGLFTTQAGVARYIRGLLRGLRLPGSGVEPVELAWQTSNYEYQQPWRSLRTAYRELYWVNFPGRLALAKLEVPLLHSTVGYWVSPRAPTRCVCTIHDLAVFTFPDRFRAWQGYSGRRCLTRAIKADRVICISQFTADQAMEMLGLPASRIDVVYNGCDFHESEAVPQERPPAIPIPSEFILFVGSLEPGKNLSLLRKSYEMAFVEGRPLPPLVIVGARWEGVASEGPPPRDWHYLGRQDDEVLVHLYRRAIALAFPSKFEGFGLPVVEAMALGCPVVCSKVSSLPEVGGEAACYAEQTPESYLQALRSLTANQETRSAHIEAGRMQARQFSWRACAQGCRASYEAALKS